MTLRQRAAENGEILADDKDGAAGDRPRSGDDAVAGDFLVLHPEIDAIMFDIGIELLERSLVEQHVEPFARGELALRMLRIDALLPAPQRSVAAAAFHFGDIGGHRALLLIWKMPSAFAWAIMQIDRKSVVSGKRVSVRLNLG